MSFSLFSSLHIHGHYNFLKLELDIQIYISQEDGWEQDDGEVQVPSRDTS